MASKDKSKKARIAALEKQLQTEKRRADEAVESNRQLEGHLRERFSTEANLREQVQNLTKNLKSTDKLLHNLVQTLHCVDFLSRYFGGIKVVGFQHTEQFGSLLNLEAGGLAFDLSHPKNSNLRLAVYSPDETEIKLAYTNLPLEDGGQIGPEALGMIMLRQEAITPEGRKKFLKLGMDSYKNLYEDLNVSRREQRGARLSERCMRHVQEPAPSTEQAPNDKGRLRPGNKRMGKPAQATLRSLKDSNVTFLRPEHLDNLLGGSHDTQRNTKKPKSLAHLKLLMVGSMGYKPDLPGHLSAENLHIGVHGFYQPAANSDTPETDPDLDPYALMRELHKINNQLLPLLRILPEEYKLRNYRDEIPDNQQ